MTSNELQPNFINNHLQQRNWFNKDNLYLMNNYIQQCKWINKRGLTRNKVLSFMNNELSGNLFYTQT